MTALFIDTNGKIKAGDFPEPPYAPLVCLEECEGDCGEVCPIIAGSKARLKAYESAVQAALDNGVDCEDQKEAEWILKTEHIIWDVPNFPYPIPYKMEVKTPNWIHSEKKLATLTLISNV